MALFSFDKSGSSDAASNNSIVPVSEQPNPSALIQQAHNWENYKNPNTRNNLPLVQGAYPVPYADYNTYPKCLQPGYIIAPSQDYNFYQQFPYLNYGYQPFPIDSQNIRKTESSHQETMYINDLQTCSIYQIEISYEECQDFIKSNKAVMSGKDYIYTVHDDFISRNANKYKHKKLERFCISRVIDYGNVYMIEVMFRNNLNINEFKLIFVNKDELTGNKICKALQNEEIPCDCSISKPVFTIVVNMAVKREAPKKSGFSFVDGHYFFASKETLNAYDYPPVTLKKLDLNGYGSDMQAIVKRLYDLTMSFKDHKLAMTLILIRHLAILTNVFADNGIRFKRFIVADTNSEMLCCMLQVFDREKLMDTLSLDQKRLDVILSESHGEVVVFDDDIKDKKSTSKALNDLYDKTYRGIDYSMDNESSNCDLSNDYIVVLGSEYLGSQLSEEKVLHLSCTEDSLAMSAAMNEVKKMNYELDTAMIKTIINDDRISEFIASSYNNFIGEAEVCNAPYANDYAILMSVYSLMQKVLYGYEKMPIPEEEMKEYLIDSFELSKNHKQICGIADEFKEVINELVINGKIQIMDYVKADKTLLQDKTTPIVYLKDDYLLIIDDVFDFITDQMRQPDNPNQVRKAIESNLKCDVSTKKTYKYSVRGLGRVTAVDCKLLSQQAALKVCSGMESVINTNDGIERIYIGCDPQGQKYYWSIGHEDASKSHMVLVGSTRCGKSCAMNHIAKQLYANGHKVIYISFKNAFPKKDLLKQGYTQSFLDENCEFIPIEALEADEISFPENKITFYYCGMVNEAVEMALMNVYRHVSSDSENEVYIVIDEAHMLSHSKGSAMYCMYNMGAGNGIHLITSYQTFSELKKAERNIIQSDITLCFKATNADEGAETAHKYAQKPFTKFGRELAALKRQQCYLIGELENSKGEIDSSPAVFVSIPNIN